MTKLGRKPARRKLRKGTKRGTPVTSTAVNEDDAPLLTKQGRAFAMADREQAKKLLGGLGAIMASWEECATALGIGEVTLWRMFKRWPDTQDAYEDGKNAGKIGLRRDQFALAKKNATMGIFLGMNYLGQKDLRNVQVDGNISHEHSIVGAMLKEIDDEARGVKTIEHQPAKKKDQAA